MTRRPQDPATPDPLADLAHELLVLNQAPDVPLGALCAVWIRLGLVLAARSDRPGDLRTLIRVGS